MKTTAVMTVSVEVDCSSTWTQAASVQQVFDQGAENGMGRLRKALGTDKNIRIVGRPSVRCVTASASEPARVTEVAPTHAEEDAAPRRKLSVIEARESGSMAQYIAQQMGLDDRSDELRSAVRGFLALTADPLPGGLPLVHKAHRYDDDDHAGILILFKNPPPSSAQVTAFAHYIGVQLT